MTTMTDAARECAEDCAVDICHELNIDDNEFNIQNIAGHIAKHFPPSVPVSRLEHLLRNSETFGWRTANWVAAIRGPIAEAK